MNPFDVSLRMRLERDGFEQGRRDVEDLRRAADRLGGSRGADELGRDLDKAGRAADETKRDIEEVTRAADRLGRNGGAGELGRNFAQVATKIDGVERAVRDVGRVIGEVDREKFDRLQRELGQTTRHAQELGQSLVQVVGKIDGVERAVREVGTAIGEVDREKFDRLQRELGQTTRKAEELERELRDIGRTKPAIEGVGGATGLLANSAGRAFAAIGAFASVDQIVTGLARVEAGFREVDRAAGATALTAERRDPTTRANIIDANKRLGRDLGVRQGEISEARQVFSAAGYSDPNAQNTMLTPTLRAAIASGASAQTIATAGRAFMSTMGGKESELGAAYDIMAKGGKLGSFELGDLAKQLPQLGTQYAATGGTGLQGLAELTALSQIAAKGAGSSDEAANNLSNYLAKIFSPETVGNFKDKRVNLRRVIDQGREKGQHPALAVLDEAMRITRGDPFKMGELFGDMQVMNALRPLMQNRNELNSMTKEIMGSSAGTIAQDYAYIQTTPSGIEDRQVATREAAGIEVGEALNPARQRLSNVGTNAARGAAHIAQGFNEGGFLEGSKRFLQAQSPLAWLWHSTNSGGAPDAEDIEARKAEAERLAEEIARDRAAIVSSGRSQNWMAESRLSVKQRRYDEMVGTLRTDLGVAETARGHGPGTAELENRIQSLTQAIRDLEKKLRDAGAPGDGPSPISFGGQDVGQPRLWNASLGGSQTGAGGGGGFTSAYSGGRPVMDGMANSPGRAASAMGGSPSGRGLGSPSAHPDLSPQAFLGGDVASFPAGMRNNNPGNLKFSGSRWQQANYPGIVGPSVNRDEGDPQIVFNSPQAGLESMARLALTKFDGGRNTVQDMISAPGGWTPGKTFASNNVAASLGIKPDAKINLRDPQQMQRFMRALITQEHGPKGAAYTDDMILGAVDATLNGRLGAGDGSAGEGLAPVSYANAGATRNRPITPELMENIQRGIAAVYGEGYRAEIYSGGQPAAGTGGRRRGSTRHDDHGRGGRAADLYVYDPDGRKVTGEELAKLGQHWTATGQGGVGMEMRGGGIHLDEHKDRARSWDYRKDGGSFTAGQAQRMRQGLAGIAPDYANPSALDPAAVAAKTGELPPRLPKPTSAPRPSASPDEGPMPTTAGLGRGGRGQTIQITQNIHGAGDPRIAAARSQREQHRAIRLADSGAMHDTMVPIA